MKKLSKPFKSDNQFVDCDIRVALRHNSGYHDLLQSETFDKHSGCKSRKFLWKNYS